MAKGTQPSICRPCGHAELGRNVLEEDNDVWTELTTATSQLPEGEGLETDRPMNTDSPETQDGEDKSISSDEDTSKSNDEDPGEFFFKLLGFKYSIS